MYRFKRQKVFAGAVICAVFSSWGCAPPHYGQPAPPADYYPMAVGDHWTYRFHPGTKRYDVDITESKVINGATTCAVAIDQDYSYMAVLPTGVYQVAQGEPADPQNAVIFDPPQRIYKLPFVVGDSWQTPVLLEPTQPKSGVVQLYGRVEAFEDVSVPAGKFSNCVRVLIDDPRDSPSDVTELWFAPGVGIVQTQTYIQRSDSLPPKTYQTQLVSYELK